VSFLFQSLLTIGLPLIALPLVIHLINLRRHRRVEWAAMEFLLESQRRNKKWIVLRQLLLLLLRTAAVALVVFMLAGPILRSSWGRLLGQGTTHHLILLDDSYSMADRWGQTHALKEAKRVVSQLVDQAMARSEPQKLTLLRFSQTAHLSAGAEFDLGDRSLDRQLADEIESLLGKLQVSETDAGPLEAIQAALGLPEPTEDEARIVTIISDFRNHQWEKETEVRQLLGQLREQSARLHLVQCVEESRPNLAVTRLEPEAGIRAAGVETWFQLKVANYGDQPAAAVTVGVTQDGHQLPAVLFDEIPPGEEVTRRFRVTFPTAGAHQLQASLESDSLEIDNVGYFACQVPGEFPILLVDGSREGDDGFFLRTALNPGGTSKPGWNPQVESPSFLRKHDQLKKFAAICLLDVARLDETEVAALEQYVEQGGGLGIFLGPQVHRPFYNERLYRDGVGLLPAPLDVPSQMLDDADRTKPDVEVSEHPVFRVFAGQRNSFLSVIDVHFYYAIDPDWRLPTSGETSILASLRNGAPFIVDRQFGKGRVVVQFCKLSPQSTDLGVWSNWSLNPVFPVYANELVGYLSSTRRQFDHHQVGDSLEFELPVADYQPEVRVKIPRTHESRTLSLTPQDDSSTYTVNPGRSERSGIWQFQLQPRDGKPEQRPLAVNVPAGEGDLHHLDRDGLAERLKGIDYEFSLATQMNASDDQLAGFRLSDTLLYLLLAVLVVEQWLAYRTSYHARV